MAIENILQATLSNLKSVMEVSNVIGKPIVSVDNALIIPISKVSVGYVAGGGQYSETPPKSKTELPEAGATGGGVNITPVGFL
ncbi:MAG: spore germination protein GerW family protein, partial [Clostridia bacterium]